MVLISLRVGRNTGDLFHEDERRQSPSCGDTRLESTLDTLGELKILNEPPRVGRRGLVGT